VRQYSESKPVSTTAGAFPNRWNKMRSEFGLILQDLRDQDSPCRSVFPVLSVSFSSYSAPKAYQANSENCAKLLKTLGGEVPEWFNGSVC
jgi:hypothetical protein